MQTVDELLGLLGGVKRIRTEQWMALCPGHHDTKSSLSIKEADGKILLKCFAGCELADILKPLKLTKADLFLKGGKAKLPKPERREIETIYHYTDAKGKPFEVVRTRPKGFYQRRPDGRGGYINNLKGIVPTLYHQGKLKRAIDTGMPVFFVEGEKDTDRLWSLGLVATTNPMGAGKWRDNYVEALRGADLAIIPDNDTPGHEHANHVARSLHGVANRIRILELPPESKDISDWLDKGGDVDQLKQLLSQCSDYEPPYEPQGKAILGPDTRAFNLTDLGNAERLVKYYGDRLHYCYERKRWLAWSGKVWEWDAGAKIAALAKLAVRNVYHEAGNEPDEKKRKELADHAKRSESDHRINAMINLAQSELGIPVKVTELDTNPWLFNCLNGTIDLRSGQLLPHRKGDLLTVIVPVEYRSNPEAQCPRWLRFLDRVIDGNADLAGYLQRAVGYSLTGDTKSQVLFFLYGLGNNGKSTFVITIRKLMGEYGARVTTELFMLRDKNVGGPKETLANLKGKRYVVASELEDSRRLAISLIKDMTGGETIRADRKYEHEIEYQPTHKLWLVGNHKPIITDTTLSIWRRMKLIPFTVTIPDKEIDPDLPSKLEEELPGILTWAVKGCLDWQQHGLNEPDAVTTATASYRHEQDILGDFIEDCCVLEPLATIAKSEMKEEYHKWCQDNTMEPITQKTFRARLIERGITDRKGTGGNRLWCGIRLKTEQELENSGKTPATSEAKVARDGQSSRNFAYKGIQKKLLEKTASDATLATNATADDIPDYPIRPCQCGCGDYYLTDDNQWLCTRCHPKPREIDMEI
jgi:putative DNA primase/helicase